MKSHDVPDCIPSRTTFISRPIPSFSMPPGSFPGFQCPQVHSQFFSVWEREGLGTREANCNYCSELNVPHCATIICVAFNLLHHTHTHTHTAIVHYIVYLSVCMYVSRHYNMAGCSKQGYSHSQATSPPLARNGFKLHDCRVYAY